ncbi:MAG TPA: DNA helicase, partial [Clostridia bacterium]|nr:DNA helicase [Clostridia bacterium]
MDNPPESPFLKFLEAGIARGGFETDDVLAALLPLMKQVLAAHEAGLVAPLDGIQDLLLAEQGYLMFAPAKVSSPEKNTSKIESLQAPVSHAIEVVGESRRTANIDEATLEVSDLSVGAADSGITKPVFLPGYRSWEYAVGHHDELTDIFSLGQLLASLACGLDFTDAGDLEIFSVHRANLFGINRRLNPVLASVIVQMTELNRHKRAPDLAQLISRLENYREQPVEIDFDRLQGFKEAGVSGKRQ